MKISELAVTAVVDTVTVVAAAAMLTIPAAADVHVPPEFWQLVAVRKVAADELVPATIVLVDESELAPKVLPTVKLPLT